MLAADKTSSAHQFDREKTMASRRSFELTPPSFVVFVISVILALAAVLVHYGHVSIPLVGAHVFDVLVAGYVVMLVGVLFKGV
jgi:type III secretory pathway component EscU